MWKDKDEEVRMNVMRHVAQWTEQRALRWFGCVERMEDDKLMKIVKSCERCEMQR